MASPFAVGLPWDSAQYAVAAPAIKSIDIAQKIAQLPEPESVVTDFMESVRTRKKFALNETNAHRSATLVNLCKISWQLGRPVHFDPATQRCKNDEAANRLIDPPMRAPWHLS